MEQDFVFVFVFNESLKSCSLGAGKMSQWLGAPLATGGS